MKQKIISFGILGLITICAIGIMMGVFQLVSPIIELNQLKAEKKHIVELFPNVSLKHSQTEIVNGEYIYEIVEARDKDKVLLGYIVKLKHVAYGSELNVAVSISVDLKVKEIVFIKNKDDEYGKILNQHTKENYPNKTADEVAGIDVTSGATGSTTTMKNMILEAIQYLKEEYLGK